MTWTCPVPRVHKLLQEECSGDYCTDGIAYISILKALATISEQLNQLMHMQAKSATHSPNFPNPVES